MLKENLSGYSHAMLSSELMDFYSYIGRSRKKGKWDMGALYARAGKIADHIVDNVRQNKQLNDYAREVLQYMKQTPIVFSEQQKDEAAALMGGRYADYYRAVKGSLKLSKEGTPADVYMQDLAEQFPGLFTGDENEGDIPSILLNTIEVLKNDFGFDKEELREYLVNDILQNYKQTDDRRTYLDKLVERYNMDDNMSHADRERSRVAHMQVADYLSEWLESHKVNVSDSTYEGYRLMIESRMVPFFRECGDLKVKDVTGDEINDYYIRIRNDGLKGTTAQRHHALLHLAFKSAVKRRVIPSNPVEQADRPKAQQYIGKYYNATELKELLDKTVDDPIHIVIFLAAYYGLRRSEVLGLKWSAVDFDNKTVSINHKVVQNDKGVVGMDVMKTKSSYRTLPLIP